MSALSSNKPYLIRAIYEWCVDNALTPLINVHVDGHTKVPVAFVRDGQIVLNIAPHATHQLSITNEDVTFQARFGGVAQTLFIPIRNIKAIYARENGQGMGFDLEPAGALNVPSGDITNRSELYSDKEPDTSRDTPPDDSPSDPGGRNHLRIIK